MHHLCFYLDHTFSWMLFQTADMRENMWTFQVLGLQSSCFVHSVSLERITNLLSMSWPPWSKATKLLCNGLICQSSDCAKPVCIIAQRKLKCTFTIQPNIFNIFKKELWKKNTHIQTPTTGYDGICKMIIIILPTYILCI